MVQQLQRVGPVFQKPDLRCSKQSFEKLRPVDLTLAVDTRRRDKRLYPTVL